jgi:hypothetical protein
MRNLFESGDLDKEKLVKLEKELTEFGLLGNLSVNISVSTIQNLAGHPDYIWDSEVSSEKTITINVDGVAQIIIALSEVKTFKDGELVSVKTSRTEIANDRKKSMIVIL